MGLCHGAFENIKAVVYDFCESRSGEHARRFLGDWRGSVSVWPTHIDRRRRS
jgi:hypothetical protein